MLRSQVFIHTSFAKEVALFNSSLFVSTFAAFWFALDASQRTSFAKALSRSVATHSLVSVTLLTMEMIVREFDPCCLLSSSVSPLSLSHSIHYATSLHFEASTLRLLNSLQHDVSSVSVSNSSICDDIALLSARTRNPAVLSSIFFFAEAVKANDTSAQSFWSVVEDRCLLSLGEWKEVEESLVENSLQRKCAVEFKRNHYQRVLELTQNQNDDVLRQYRICAFLVQEQYQEMDDEFQKWGVIPSPQIDPVFSELEQVRFYLFSLASSLHLLSQNRIADAQHKASETHSLFLHHYLDELRHSRNTLPPVNLPLVVLRQFDLFLHDWRHYSSSLLHACLAGTEDVQKWSLILPFQKIIRYSQQLLQVPGVRENASMCTHRSSRFRLLLAAHQYQQDPATACAVVEEVKRDAERMAARADASEASEWSRVRTQACVQELEWKRGTMELGKTEWKRGTAELEKMVEEVESLYPCDALFRGYMMLDDLFQSVLSQTPDKESLQLTSIQVLVSALNCLPTHASVSHITLLYHLLGTINSLSHSAPFHLIHALAIDLWRPVLPVLVHSFIRRDALWRPHSFQSEFYAQLVRFLSSERTIASRIVLSLLEEGTEPWSDELIADFSTKYTRLLKDAIAVRTELLRVRESKFCRLYELVRRFQNGVPALSLLADFNAVFSSPDTVLFVGLNDV